MTPYGTIGAVLVGSEPVRLMGQRVCWRCGIDVETKRKRTDQVTCKDCAPYARAIERANRVA